MTTYLPPNRNRNVKYVLLLTNSDWQQNQSQIERNVEWISLSTIKSKLDRFFYNYNSLAWQEAGRFILSARSRDESIILKMDIMWCDFWRSDWTWTLSFSISSKDVLPSLSSLVRNGKNQLTFEKSEERGNIFWIIYHV